jgi:hypothetical protein
MAASSYENALQMAASLSHEERLRLIQELSAQTSASELSEDQTSLLLLCGLGQEIWNQMDAQEYVRLERSSWNG